jgi:hypothetical protein
MGQMWSDATFKILRHDSKLVSLISNAVTMMSEVKPDVSSLFHFI